MRKTRLIQVAAAVSTILALGTYSAAFAADVVIASSGGGWQEAQDKALWAPAAKALNITYTQDTFQNWAEARAQVESGSVTWDIIQIGIADEPQAKAAGVLEKLDPDVVNKADFPGLCHRQLRGQQQLLDTHRLEQENLRRQRPEIDG